MWDLQIENYIETYLIEGVSCWNVSNSNVMNVEPEKNILMWKIREISNHQNSFETCLIHILKKRVIMVRKNIVFSKLLFIQNIYVI